MGLVHCSGFGPWARRAELITALRLFTPFRGRRACTVQTAQRSRRAHGGGLKVDPLEGGVGRGTRRVNRRRGVLGRRDWSAADLDATRARDLAPDAWHTWRVSIDFWIGRRREFMLAADVSTGSADIAKRWCNARPTLVDLGQGGCRGGSWWVAPTTRATPLSSPPPHLTMQQTSTRTAAAITAAVTASEPSPVDALAATFPAAAIIATLASHARHHHRTVTASSPPASPSHSPPRSLLPSAPPSPPHDMLWLP